MELASAGAAPAAAAAAAPPSGLRLLPGSAARHPLLNVLPPTGLEQLIAFPPEPRLELRIHEAQSAAALDEPIQFGLFAKAGARGMVPPVVFRTGDRVSMYGGVLVHSRDLRDLPHSHARRIPDSDYVLDGLPLAHMLLRPVPRTLSRLTELLVAGIAPLLPSSRPGAFTAAELARFEQSPLGFMANTAEAHKCNVRVASFSVPVGDMRYGVPMLVASADIRAGEEILSPYNTSESRQLRVPIAPVPQRVVRAPFLADSFDRYNLLDGNPSHTGCLQRQRDNLVRFVEDNKAEFDKLPYEPWTRGRVPLSKSRGGQLNIHVDVRPSLLVPGLLGGYLREPIAAASSSVEQQLLWQHTGSVLEIMCRSLVWCLSKFCLVLRCCRPLVLTDYPGVLMSEPLMDAFTKLYHCPTALRLEQLDYRIGERVPNGYSEFAAETGTVNPRAASRVRRDAGRLVPAAEVVEISLVGDPTAPGAIINDGLYSGRQRQSTDTPKRQQPQQY
jgi:hypothetical protein